MPLKLGKHIEIEFVSHTDRQAEKNAKRANKTHCSVCGCRTRNPSAVSADGKKLSCHQPRCLERFAERYTI